MVSVRALISVKGAVATAGLLPWSVTNALAGMVLVRALATAVGEIATGIVITQLPPAVMAPPTNEIVVLPATALSAPPQVLVGAGVARMLMPVPMLLSKSVNEVIAALGPPTALESVILRSELPVCGAVIGLKTLLTLMSAVIVKLPDMADVLVPKLLDTAPAGTVLTRTPGTALPATTTGKVITQLLAGLMVPPARLKLVAPGVAVSTPPQLLVGAGVAARVTLTPMVLNKLSVKVVLMADTAAELLRVIVSRDVPSCGTELGVKPLAPPITLSGLFTVSVALATG